MSLPQDFFKNPKLMSMSLSLALLLPTGFGHMTIHFSSARQNLQTMLLQAYYYEHPNLCPYQSVIQKETLRFKATRPAFYHHAKGTEIKSQDAFCLLYINS